MPHKLTFEGKMYSDRMMIETVAYHHHHHYAPSPFQKPQLEILGDTKKQSSSHNSHYHHHHHISSPTSVVYSSHRGGSRSSSVERGRESTAAEREKENVTVERVEEKTTVVEMKKIQSKKAANSINCTESPPTLHISKSNHNHRYYDNNFRNRKIIEDEKERCFKKSGALGKADTGMEIETTRGLIEEDSKTKSTNLSPDSSISPHTTVSSGLPSATTIIGCSVASDQQKMFASVGIECCRKLRGSDLPYNGCVHIRGVVAEEAEENVNGEQMKDNEMKQAEKKQEREKKQKEKERKSISNHYNSSRCGSCSSSCCSSSDDNEQKTKKRKLEASTSNSSSTRSTGRSSSREAISSEAATTAAETTENGGHSLYGSSYGVFENSSRSRPPLVPHHRKRGRSSSCRNSSRRRSSPTWRKCRRRQNSASRSTSVSPVSSDYEEQIRRSRSRERRRIRAQHLTIKKYCKTNESQVFWDGFQWVTKVEGSTGYDQQMNATRRARRLHIGNLPLFMNVTEEDFRNDLWKLMIEQSLCSPVSVCPILHIWFARDRGGNFGFMEMSTVEDAHNALKLDNFIWNGVPIRINRPTDWKKAVSLHAIDVLASTSNLATAESLAAAAQQAALTGNTAGLLSLVNKLPENQQRAILEVMNQHVIPNFQNRNTNASLMSLDFVQQKIKADLLVGDPSRVVRIAKPASTLVGDDEYEEVLCDIKDECGKYGSVLSTLIVSPKIKQKLSSISDVDVGDVFFEFATTLQADNCILNMSGRIYDSKPVKMNRFDDEIFDSKLKPFVNNLFIKILEAAQ